MRRALFVATAALALWLAPGALAAGWCGTSESSTDRPDLQTGQQIHAVVVQPADAGDNFVADANKMADDITSLTGWWVGQDPTRVPRFDLAAFPGGSCVDISYVRLPLPAASYRGASSAFDAIKSQLSNTVGFLNAYKDYYAYYDGPAVQPNVCGTGGGDFDQADGFAIVWLAGCPDVPTDGIGAHELLHVFGALPIGAPNVCTPLTDPQQVADFGHPCDSPTDVLYPFASGAPLAQQVLDFGHDDYYGHSGSWPDMQDSVFLHHTDAPAVQLSVAFSGAGAVSSDLPGLVCQAACATLWDSGSQVTLSTTPVDGTRFIRWTGGCIGNGSCVLNLTQSTTVTAVFGPTKIPIKISASGKGSVKCSPACSKTFSAGDPLALRAVAAKGWKFAAWSGGCIGTRLTCVPQTDFALTVRATFKKKR